MKIKKWIKFILVMLGICSLCACALQGPTRMQNEYVGPGPTYSDFFVPQQVIQAPGYRTY